MKYLLLIPLLVGCSTVPTTVKVPVPVKCTVETPVEPQYRFSAPYSSVFEGIRDLLGDRELALAYENELRVALQGCKD